MKLQKYSQFTNWFTKKKYAVLAVNCKSFISENCEKKKSTLKVYHTNWFALKPLVYALVFFFTHFM